MIQLEPGEVFAIVRQLADPFDNTTYYVRAEIRNAKTDALLERVSLTDRGSLRFSANWNVTSTPPDGGLWISIMTAVYTDDAFTTRADNYSNEIDTYLVEPRPKWQGHGGGGGISKKDLREVLREVMPGLFPESETEAIVSAITEALGSRTDEVKRVVAGVDRKIDGIEVSPVVKVTTTKVDVQPAIDAALRAAVAAEETGKSVDERMDGFRGAVEGLITSLEARILGAHASGSAEMRQVAQGAFQDFKEALRSIAGKPLDMLDSMESSAPAIHPHDMIREIARTHKK